MKLLAIGIDGGTKKIIENMPMPFTQGLFLRSCSKVLEEDLISRGWAEILTGQHASENKGFYLMPYDDLEYAFSMSYSQSDMMASASHNILWERVNRSGNTVGIANVPTTGPAAKVDGFFIAGGGGGASLEKGFSTDQIYPPECKEILNRNSYITDLRLPAGTKTVTDFIQKIIHAEKAQKDTFIELSLSRSPDFGFHCFRITTEIQYLARYEIERCIGLLQKYGQVDEVRETCTEVQNAIFNYYLHLDACIEEIFTYLKPSQYLFLADHSTSLFEYEANIDVWLGEEGYLEKMTPYEQKLAKLYFKIRKRKRKLDTVLGKAPKLPAYRRPVTKFHPKKTKAFGTFYDTGNFAGVFINDKERFGGPVETRKEIGRLTDEICDRLNKAESARKYGLHAFPYRRSYGKSKYQKLMPDIKIDKPDTIYFSGRRDSLIQSNPNLVPLANDLTGIKYPHTGLKGSDPLFVYSPDLEKFIADSDPNDLRLAYRMICRYFQT
jgi:predicted AlkP superfamily phosphohydrolase/phosphomutase